MPVMSEFQEERESIKHAPFKKKLQYFKDYYLLKTVLIISAIIIVISFVYTQVTKKDVMLYVDIINHIGSEEAEEAVVNTFSQSYLENTEKQEIWVDTQTRIAVSAGEINSTYQDEQRLMTMTLTNTLDLIIADRALIEKYAASGWFFPLSEIMDEETVNRLVNEEKVCYAEGQPVGIYVEPDRLFSEYYTYVGDGEPEIYAAIVMNSEHVELAKAFLEFILQ